MLTARDTGITGYAVGIPQDIAETTGQPTSNAVNLTPKRSTIAAAAGPTDPINRSTVIYIPMKPTPTVMALLITLPGF